MVIADCLAVNTLVTGKIFVIPVNADGKAGAISEVALDRPTQAPDGMRSFGKNSVLLVESGGTGRLTPARDQ